MNPKPIADLLSRTWSLIEARDKAGLRNLFESTPPEQRLELWSAVAADKRMSRSLAFVHDAVVDTIVTGVFGVPVGDAGVGVEPRIPEELKATFNKRR